MDKVIKILLVLLLPVEIFSQVQVWNNGINIIEGIASEIDSIVIDGKSIYNKGKLAPSQESVSLAGHTYGNSHADEQQPVSYIFFISDTTGVLTEQGRSLYDANPTYFKYKYEAPNVYMQPTSGNRTNPFRGIVIGESAILINFTQGYNTVEPFILIK